MCAPKKAKNSYFLKCLLFWLPDKLDFFCSYWELVLRVQSASSSSNEFIANKSTFNKANWKAKDRIKDRKLHNYDRTLWCTLKLQNIEMIEKKHS